MKQLKLTSLSISELITHIIFWLIYLWLTLNNQMFVISVDNIGSNVLNVNESKLNSILSILSFYWFYFFVIPRYFNLARLKFFFIAVISILVFTEITNMVKNTHDGSNIIYWINLGSQFFLALWALLIQLIFENFKRNVRNKEQTIQHTKTELAFLKQQIHPHFLFNVLNCLYSSSYKYGDTKTSHGIGQLADLLRYMLYETKSEKVPIKEELTYLTNYIELQMLRFSEDVILEYTDKGTVYNIDIVPMLFITLIENAFKHGITPEKKNTIVINISYNEEEIAILVANPLTPSSQVNDTVGGVGLVNLRRRLELLYPDNHEFNTIISNNTFTAKLILR